MVKDVNGCAEDHQRLALSGRHEAARRGIPQKGIWRIPGRRAVETAPNNIKMVYEMKFFIKHGSISRMIITSSSFDDGGMIPKKFTCDGGDMNPELLIQNVPAEVQVSCSFCTIRTRQSRRVHALDGVEYRSADDDHKRGEHSAGKRGGSERRRKAGYFGPCPPPDAPHHYHFQLYALDADPRSSRSRARGGAPERNRKTYVSRSAELVGLYGRGLIIDVE